MQLRLLEAFAVMIVNLHRGVAELSSSPQQELCWGVTPRCHTCLPTKHGCDSEGTWGHRFPVDPRDCLLSGCVLVAWVSATWLLFFCRGLFVS